MHSDNQTFILLIHCRHEPAPSMLCPNPDAVQGSMLTPNPTTYGKPSAKAKEVCQGNHLSLVSLGGGAGVGAGSGTAAVVR